MGMLLCRNCKDTTAISFHIAISYSKPIYKYFTKSPVIKHMSYVAFSFPSTRGPLNGSELVSNKYLL